ncbi:MAG: hypothetical protein B5M51_06380 [Anaerolinea sp. 4484_236]|nr:MAG: hypothetical protein B5M51_06380 [Anaerolinea sp. 4484_236]
MSTDNYSRLEKLFVGLGEQAAHQPPLKDAPKTLGWTWECNSKGLYTACSSEVESVIGYTPDDLIGKPLASFGVDEQSQSTLIEATLIEATNAQHYPAEVSVIYESAVGEKIPVTVHILSSPQLGEDARWQGFTQVVSSRSPIQKPPPRGMATPPVLPLAAPPSKPPAVYEPSIAPVTKTGYRSLQTRSITAERSTLAVPVNIQEDKVGLLEFIDENRQQWSNEEQQLVKEVALQLSLALETAYLFQQTESQAWELEVLNNMGRDLSELLEIENILQIIHKYTSQLMDASSFLVAFYDAQTGTLSFPYAWEDNEPINIPSMTNKRGLTQYVIDSKKPLLISKDVDKTREMLGLNKLIIGKPAQSWLGVPMLVGDEAIGAIALQNQTRSGVFNSHHRDLLLSIARQGVISIQNARLFRQTQTALNETQILLATSNTASQSLVLEKTLQDVLRQINIATDIDVSLIALFNSQTQQLELAAEQNLPATLKQSFNQEGFTDTLCLLQAIAQQIGVAIENAHLFEETQQRSQELVLINRIVSEVASSFDLNKSLGIVATELGKAINVQTRIALINEGGATSTVIAGYSPNPNRPPVKGLEIPIAGNPSTEQVIETKKTLIIENAQENPLTAPIHEMMRQHNIHSLGIFPLIVQNEVIGTVGLDILEEGRSFRENEIRLAETIITQAATAIQNARLFNEVQRRSTQLQAAAEVSRTASSMLDPNPLLRETVNLIRDRFGLYYVGVFLIDEEGTFSGEARKWAVLQAGTGEAGRLQVERRHQLEIGGSSMVGQCIRDGKANISQLASEEAQRFSNPLLPDTKSEMALPLISRGNTIGAMSIQSTKANAFTKEDIAVFQTMADQVANALQNAKLFNQTERDAHELKVLNEMSQALSTELNVAEIIQTIYQYVSHLMDTSYFFVALHQEEQNLIEFPLVVENNVKSKLPPMQKREGLTQYVIDTKSSLLIGENIEQKIQELGLERIIEGSPAKSWLGVPMMLGDKVLGVISAQNTNRPRVFNEHHRELLMSVAQQSAIAIQNANLFEQTQRQLANISTIQEITSDLSAALTFTGVVNTLLAHLASAISTHTSSLFTVEEETIIRAGVYPSLKDSPPINEVLSLSNYPLIATAIKTAKPLIRSIEDDQLPELVREELQATGIAYDALIPITGADGILGILSLSRKQSEENFTEDEISLAITLANQAAVAIQNARLYEEQRETAERLREVDKLKSQFLANMSHELRTPLNSIIGFSRVILRGIDGPITDLQEKDLTAVHESGQHLLTMINDILDISKIESGKMEIAIEDVIIPDIIESVLTTASGLVKDKPVKLEKDIEANLPIARADSVRVRQILLNFLSNAAKFTEEGSITVKANAIDARTKIRISVTDTGPGIAEEDQDKLFKRFSQVDGSTTREAGGTGLGLSISRQLANMQHGDIGMTSNIGEGSTFFFTLPAAVPKGIPQKTEKKVLLAIDDDEQITKLYSRYLSYSDYEVISLTEPDQAIEYIQELRPEIITLDVLFGADESGWKILETLKEDAELSSIPIIICSILDEKAKGLSLGAAEYLTKPILEKDLVSAIEKIEALL